MEKHFRNMKERKRMSEMFNAVKDAAILIPSLEPDERLPAYIAKLSDCGFAHIIVVDDGSSEEYQPIFREVENIDRTVVLHHEINRGKGIALKTGYQYILDHLQDANVILTADSDGQHTVPDCIHLAEEAQKGEKALYLGSRAAEIVLLLLFSNFYTVSIFRILRRDFAPSEGKSFHL